MRYTPRQYAEALYHALTETAPKDVDRVLDNFIQLLRETGELGQFEAIAQAYSVYDQQQRGIQEVQLATARKLTAEERHKLTTQLNKVLRSKLEVRDQVDRRLIGGAVIRADDTRIDASIRGLLEKLRHHLTKLETPT